MNDKDKIEYLENALENLKHYVNDKRLTVNYLQATIEMELAYTRDKDAKNASQQRYQYASTLDRAYREIQTLIKDMLHEYDQQAGNTQEKDTEK